MKTNYVTTGVSADNQLLVSYIPERQTLVVDLAKMKGIQFKGQWFDPRKGGYKEIGNPSPQLQQFTPPSNEDWIRLVQAIKE